jgi:L-threonylcarbamoyladenylate synthase
LLIYPNSAAARESAGRAVSAGRIVAFRTDTFYGLGVDPFNPAALHALNELKGRDGKPILVVLSDAGQAARLISGRGAAFEALCARHWPGPLTLVARARADVPELLTAGTGTVGVRLPDDEEAREVVRACGGALTATSANPAGRPPARTAAEVAEYFPQGLALVLDGGDARSDKPSTVVDVTGPRPRLLREGVVTRRELEESLRDTSLSSIE